MFKITSHNSGHETEYDSESALHKGEKETVEFDLQRNNKPHYSVTDKDGNLVKKVYEGRDVTPKTAEAKKPEHTQAHTKK